MAEVIALGMRVKNTHGGSTREAVVVLIDGEAGDVIVKYVLPPRMRVSWQRRNIVPA